VVFGVRSAERCRVGGDPDWNTTQASECLKAGDALFEFHVDTHVPEMVRTAPEPTPNFSVAAMAAARNLGWV